MLTHKEMQFKFDEFRIETASRKVLQELLERFNLRDQEYDGIIKEIKEKSQISYDKVEAFERIIKRVQH